MAEEDTCWCHSFDTLLYYIGLFFILYYLWELWGYIWRDFLKPTDRPLDEYVKGKKQPWALISGSTEGIGREYAFQLARKGVSIVLCARNKAKLEAVAAQIKEKYPNVDTKYVIVDASTAELKDFDRIAQELQHLELTFLVNNVGISHLTQPFEDLEVQEIYDMININARFPVLLTRAVLPIMKKCATPKSRGAIINVSSVSGLGPTPYLALYSSTKYMNRAFSDALGLELQSANIDVQVLSPGFVRTAMTEKMRPDWRHCESDLVVIRSLDQLPSTDVQPFWVHSLQGVFVIYSPVWLSRELVIWRMNNFKELAKRAIAKKKQAKTE